MTVAVINAQAYAYRRVLQILDDQINTQIGTAETAAGVYLPDVDNDSIHLFGSKDEADEAVVNARVWICIYPTDDSYEVLIRGVGDGVAEHREVIWPVTVELRCEDAPAATLVLDDQTASSSWSRWTWRRMHYAGALQHTMEVYVPSNTAGEDARCAELVGGPIYSTDGAIGSVVTEWEIGQEFVIPWPTHSIADPT